MKWVELELVALEAMEQESPADREIVDALLRKGQGSPDGRLLLDSTVSWITRLPKDVRPLELARQYPRIANSLAEVWVRVGRRAEYLESLIADRHDRRKELSREASQELARLKSYHADLLTGTAPLAAPA